MCHILMGMTPQRPTNPRLAKVFDEAIRSGKEIRYVDESTLVVYQVNQWGCGGLLFLLLIGLLTAFIVPLILLILGALSPGGQVITYTVRPNGRLKVKRQAARK